MNPSLPYKTIVTDLDGTLVNTIEGVCALLWAQFGVALAPADCGQYDVTKSLWNLGVEIGVEIGTIFRDPAALEQYLQRNAWQNGNFYRDLVPYWNWHQTLQRALYLDIEVILLTARPPIPDVIQATEAWCAKWGYGELELLFAKSWEHGKVEALQEITDRPGRDPATTYFFDDDWSIVRAVRKALPELLVEVPVRPWT